MLLVHKKLCILLVNKYKKYVKTILQTQLHACIDNNKGIFVVSFVLGTEPNTNGRALVLI